MSNFVSTLEGISYDFTAVPTIGGKDGERCTGKGRVPEPDDEQAQAFVDFAEKLMDDFERDDDGNIKVDELKQPIAKPEALDWINNRKVATAALVNMNHPQEHLDELPIRHFKEYLIWFLGEYRGTAG